MPWRRRQVLLLGLLFSSLLFCLPLLLLQHSAEERPDNGQGNQMWLSAENRKENISWPQLGDAHEIDMVYTWVDGEKSRNRVRQHSELVYAIRCAFRHAPWLRHFYIVTNGEYPSWLKIEDPRVTLVTHAELWPDPTQLPTENSNAIESVLHRINGLSEWFLYSNDDMFIGKMTNSSYWYSSPRYHVHVQKNILVKTPSPEEWKRKIDQMNSEWKSLFQTNRMLDLHWGRKARYYVTHSIQLFNTRVLSTSTQLWRRAFEQMQSSLGRTRSAIDVNIRFLHAHVLVEEYGADLLSEDLKFESLHSRSTGLLRRIAVSNAAVFCFNDDMGKRVNRKVIEQFHAGLEFICGADASPVEKPVK